MPQEIFCRIGHAKVDRIDSSVEFPDTYFLDGLSVLDTRIRYLEKVSDLPGPLIIRFAIRKDDDHLLPQDTAGRIESGILPTVLCLQISEQHFGEIYAIIDTRLATPESHSVFDISIPGSRIVNFAERFDDLCII